MINCSVQIMCTEIQNYDQGSHSLNYKKIPGLFQALRSIFQDRVVSQQCLNIATNSG